MLEWGQLAAEIGIVIASIALLLGSRAVWLVSAVLGLICGGTVTYTFVHTRAALVVADARIKTALENIQKIESDDDANDATGDKVNTKGSNRPAPAVSPAGHHEPTEKIEAPH